MQVGDILKIAPSIFSFEDVSDPDDGRQRRRKKLPCTVIWVHPAKRFLWWNLGAQSQARPGGRPSGLS